MRRHTDPAASGSGDGVGTIKSTGTPRGEIHDPIALGRESGIKPAALIASSISGSGAQQVGVDRDVAVSGELGKGDLRPSGVQVDGLGTDDDKRIEV
ncbi:hypothetical protein [Aeromicrobium sp. UC242_57]|uniref:hypothetical protein n=1 Tax=Aeromicrobium sp. UC242_57 TaxID=3374624 RepID=UPI0037904499